MENDRRILFRAIYEHAWIIQKRLSLYSSLGNHTVAECLGLVMAGGLFRQDARGKVWLKTAIKLLAQEVAHQILRDGGPAEQSFSYHRFVLDLFWLAVRFLEDNRLFSNDTLKQRLQKGEQFYQTACFTEEQTPNIGDNDQAWAVAPGLMPKRGNFSATISHATKPQSEITTFPETGLTVVKDGQLFITFDHGPLGMAPLYNHGHADALSITLTLNGQPLFIDPGTSKYSGAEKWRRYFKGTRAHNTVCVDGRDQAEQVTGFIWDQPYDVRFSKKESGEEVHLEASHDGYMRLAKPVKHTRCLRLQGDRIEIRDTFEGRGEHTFELHFHIHPDVSFSMSGRDVTLEAGDRTALLRCMEHDLTPFTGQEEPPLGWFSPTYGRLIPTTTLRAARTGRPESITFTTIFEFSRTD